MARQWFVAQSVRNREIAAAVSAVAHGFEAYLPIIQRYRRIGRQLVEMSVPRFGTYLFVRFDRVDDPWPNLCREHGPNRAYFTNVLCNIDGLPSPVPDKAMEAIRAYQPAIIAKPNEPIVYREGQRVTWLKAGVRREAVFVEYFGGNRQKVRTWIFGSERIVEVTEAELEPLDLDILANSAATCAT